TPNRGRDRTIQLPTKIGEPLLGSMRPLCRPASERGLTHPEPVGHPYDQVRLGSSRKPLFGLLIAAAVTKPGRQGGVEASSTSYEVARSVLLRLGIAECERAP